MTPFQLSISGDLATATGQPATDLATDLLTPAANFKVSFLADQQPPLNDPTYQDRLYSLEVTAAHVANADGIVICRPWVKPSAFARGADKLTAIGRAGIGYDKIDLTACTQNNVVVFNAPHGLNHSTASAAMLLILALSRRLHVQERIIRQGRWDKQSEALGDDLAGQTLGIVGFGHTAIELVRLLAPFQMKVIAYSPHANPADAAKWNVTLVPTLEDVFRQSDYISLHNRLTEKTRNSITEPILHLMKPTAFFVNVARGEIVDEQALIKLLQEHKIAGAGLDVFEHEPLPLSSPFLQMDNVLLTPHWLCSTRQAGRATNASVMEGMLQISRGQIPPHVLNPAVLERPEFQRKLQRFVGNH